ncbi:type III-B CRISPR-associated protein Cas10/Cmr2 [Microcoleus sp. FACHB-1515]|uniref:type III-B CRISPR-associated protein Cas10/Cmr2 n=1 Tax=Cyanophyceae TaxID=3028117 RepID=UPI001686FD8D|nr:type III-B CRISPR-associated protein Cas10/Cmr2 [Microcoleus sp. FACHB-1515]MBD2090636.1 type III-B CRISPR-associated protein Cas10/Cmr2 [Microcoleus sp. FACHB-1515]
MDYYSRKLYALLHESHGSRFFDRLDCFEDCLEALQQWWETQGKLASELASTADRINLGAAPPSSQAFEIHHPISGQKLENATNKPQPNPDQAQLIDTINAVWHSIAALEPEARMQQLFTWCWRFVPESSGRSLLTPADRVLPDTALHSHNSAVSALTGALFPPDWQGGEPDRPYLVLFTFSPIQEFIKASRKFLDFWAGSYLLHYLSAILCWEAAQLYGADAIITPSLWSQEIIDALIAQTYPDISANITVVDRFYDDRTVALDGASADRRLSTINIAGFPNTITLLAPNREAADRLVATLKATLQGHWQTIATMVKETVKSEVRDFLDSQFDRTWADLSRDLNPEAAEALAIELKQYQQPGCWEWNALWDAQIDHTWETYAVAVPLGHPQQALTIGNLSQPESEPLTSWIAAQTAIANPRDALPTAAESSLYHTFNVGSWWGSYQARLGQLIQAVKNTRNWQIPAAPGERSSISGLYSALHPRLLYRDRFRNGCGVANDSLKLFWQLMARVYPGLFNGSERLNAIELTKRMAWKYGGIAAALGIAEVEVPDLLEAPDIDRTVYTAPDGGLDLRDFDNLIRFPNLSSIAAARFAHDHPDRVKAFWHRLSLAFKRGALKSQYRKFCQLTRRPFQIDQVDCAIAQGDRNVRYNGVMFSSKWLADDLQLDADQTIALRQAVTNAHQQLHFGDSSPSDWWVLVLGDGDGMGSYVNGNRLKPYGDYLETDWVDRTILNDTHWTDLLQTQKRMGPGTHVGLNRALLDFSNRLVPYLTEERCCGRVIYSGGDDVMVALPLADLPNFLLSLRAAWSGSADPAGEFEADGGYWKAIDPNVQAIMGDRSLFTMGKDATMSLGVVIAHKSVPLPTVLELLWEAEKERAKKLLGGSISRAHGESNAPEVIIPAKDGLCFRVVYGSGNVLESHLKGHLLEGFTQLLDTAADPIDLAPVLYRLASELPPRCQITPDLHLFRTAATVILNSRDLELPDRVRDRLLDWLDQWEIWAWTVIHSQKALLSQQPHLSAIAAEAEARRSLGTRPEDLASLLRFAAFWISRRQQERSWTTPAAPTSPLAGAKHG